MCGISGWVLRGDPGDAGADMLRRMNDRLAHRGPDGEGRFVDGQVAIAMRRLSIIDLEGGWQPLFNADRSLALVCNGEIYNHVELRQQLEARGHRFATHSDVEVILHLYVERGLECVQALQGMFAFALLDRRAGRLILARDRMGEKPLYIRDADGQLVFASEMKALLAAGGIPLDLDATAIDAFFHLGYVPEPATAVAGVRKLPAAHYFVVDTRTGERTQTCYWRMEDAPALDGDRPAILREVLDEVTRQVIRSDVPVGVALSGGLDSSAIAMLAARHYPGTMQAFSVGYEGRPPSDERGDAKALADHLGMPFHDVEVADDDVVSSFPHLNAWRDDPIADIAGHGYYAVMRAARDAGVPVMLQGQGGDELFWGYPWLRSAVARNRRKAQYLANGPRAALATVLAQLDRPTGLRPLFRALRGRFGAAAALASLAEYRALGPGQLLMFELTPDYRAARRDAHGLYGIAMRDAAPQRPAADLLWLDGQEIDIALTRAICQTYLMANGIAQGDRLSMTSSVELRLPLLDSRLVEAVIGLRKSRPDDGLPPKHWLREAMRGELPDWVIDRPKRGFAPPVRRWYARLFASHGTLLEDGELVARGILTSSAARLLASGPMPDDGIIPLSFKALVLECWCRAMKSEVRA